MHSQVRAIQIFNPCTSRPGVCQCLAVQAPMDNMPKKKPSTPMTHVAFKSKLRSVVRSSMHPCPGNWVAIGCVVADYASAAHAFSAGIKCRHCITSISSIPCPYLQCRHSIRAQTAWAAKALCTPARPIAIKFPGCMHDLTNERISDSQAT